MSVELSKETEHDLEIEDFDNCVTPSFWAVIRARKHGHDMGFDAALEILESERSRRRELGHSRHVRRLDESIQLLKMNRVRLKIEGD